MPHRHGVTRIATRVLGIFVTGLVVAGTASGAGAAGTGSHAPAASPSAPPAPAQPTAAVVTLVTGDRVQVVRSATGSLDAAVVPDPFDPSPGALVSRSGDSLRVYPTEALPYLRSGALDPALFDVAGLMEQGLDDARTDVLPLMATSPTSPLAPGAATPARSSRPTVPAEPEGAESGVTVPALGLAGLQVDKVSARTFWADLTRSGSSFSSGIGRLWLDRPVEVHLDRSVAQIDAPAAYALGLDGTGTTVAVLDTGIDNEHPDLAGQVVKEEDFTGDGSTDDRFGHGTHVASIVAGTGARSGGTYRGVAPGARLLDGRVLDDNGFGQESWVLAGMQWAADLGADVVNMSLGGLVTDGTDPMAQAIDTLSAGDGPLFVVAAGNDGAPGTVSSPGSSNSALTVGSVDREDAVSFFSSQGPREGDGAPKPELTAPGEEIVAAQADGTSLGPVAAPGYVALSGTSMATPHVAGAAAILQQEHPDWTGAQIKSRLVATAAPLAGTSVFAGGSGRVDVGAAVGPVEVQVSPATLALGFYPWPHGAETPVTRTLTYTNPTTAPVALALEATVADADGAPLPADALALGNASVVVPAGGSRELTVTLAPAGVAPGEWSGVVTATTAAGETLRTPVGFVSETERYDVAIDVIDRAGAPVQTPIVELFNLDTGDFVSFFDQDPQDGVYRLSPGRWNVGVYDVSRDGELTLGLLPEVTISGDTEVTVDLRTARPVRLDVPDPAVDAVVDSVGYARSIDGSSLGSTFFTDGGVRLFATPTPPPTIGELDFGTFSSRAVPQVTASVVRGPEIDLTPFLVTQDDRFDGTRTLRVRDAATVRRGEAALVEVDASGPIDDVVSAAAARGAAAVIFYLTSDDVFIPVPGPLPVPTVLVPTHQGEALAAAAGRRLEVRFRTTYASPVVYELGRIWPGGVPRNAVVRFRQRDLARIDETYRTLNGPGTAIQGSFPDDSSGVGVFPLLPVPIGGSRQLYLAPQFDWGGDLWFGSVPDPDFGPSPAVAWSEDSVARPAGSTSTRTWVRQAAHPEAVAGRVGDELFAGVQPFTDGDGRPGSFFGIGDASWRLSSGGQIIGEGDGSFVDVTVPADLRTYTLDATARVVGDPTWRLSTRVSGTWTFRSETPPTPPPGNGAPEDEGDPFVPVPLLNVDADLPLRHDNTAPAGRSMSFDVHSTAFDGDPLRLRSLTVETSADGGATWTRARSVTRSAPDAFRVTVANPARPGDVSLRLSAKGPDGTAVVQTVTAAYAVR